MDKRVLMNIKRIEDIFKKNNYDKEDKVLFLEARLEYANAISDEAMIEAIKIISDKILKED